MVSRSVLVQQALLKDFLKVETSAPHIAVAMSLQEKCLFSKYLENSTTTPEQDKTALLKFIAANERCERFLMRETSEFERFVVRSVRHYLYTWLGDYSISDNYAEDFDVGPGASIGSRYNDIYTKLFTSKLSYCSEYQKALYVSNLVPGSTHYEAEAHRASQLGFERVRGNRLAFVPKKHDTSRVICTEPTLAMMAQKAIAAKLERVLIKLGIRLDKQPDVNRRLARWGSYNGSFATIDLSSASDTISLGLIDSIFPVSWRNAFALARSPETLLPDGTWLKLSMISSMGNAFTFPLQTLIFTSLVYSVYDWLRIRHRRYGAKRFGVFGDDIIVANRAYPLVMEALDLFGFIHNEDKSFDRGLFRESCGGDYFSGYNVRPVFIKQLATDTQVVSAYNRLFEWSRRHEIKISHTLRTLLSFVDMRNVPRVPYGSPVDWGLWSTREQAIAAGAKKLPNGILRTTRWTSVAAEVVGDDRINPAGALISVSTGRVVSCSSKAFRDSRNKGALRLTPKGTSSKANYRITSLATSVWPGTATVDAAIAREIGLSNGVPRA